MPVITGTVEARYISQNHTHLQVEVVDAFGVEEEVWIPLSAIHSEFNIFDDLMEIDVDVDVLEELGINYD